MIIGVEGALEKLEGEKWEAVPTLIDTGVFTDIGYNIPKNGEAEVETNWEWLYGKLGPGTYKITKTVLDSGAGSEGDSLNRYTMSAQFISGSSCDYRFLAHRIAKFIGRIYYKNIVDRPINSEYNTVRF